MCGLDIPIIEKKIFEIIFTYCTFNYIFTELFNYFCNELFSTFFEQHANIYLKKTSEIKIQRQFKMMKNVYGKFMLFCDFNWYI